MDRMDASPIYTDIIGSVIAWFNLIGLRLVVACFIHSDILGLDRKSFLTMVYGIVFYILAGLYAYFAYFRKKKK